MPERKTEILVGFTITLALIILVMGVIFGKGIHVFSSRVYLDVGFSNISGVEAGDPVVIRGVDAGRVEKVTLNSESAVLRLSIKENIPLYSDLIVTIENRELMGGKQVVIYPGESGQYADMNRVFRGESRGDPGLLLARGEGVIGRIDSVLKQASLLFSNRLSMILRNMQEGTKQVTELIKENRGDISLSISRLERITDRFENDSTAAQIGRLVADLDSAAILVKQIARRMESENGTAGILLRDRSLYDQALRTFTDLDSLITDIKSNPKKYIHVSVF
jgi:phospholipid/cholesterol/gamma-HCH transport system substrate-binding protein